jgi:hypothetical protein
MWGHECICVYKCNSQVSQLSITWHRNIGLCLADELNFYPKKNTLIPNRVRGAIFDLVCSFGIYIGGDPACVPLSLEGLSEATTCKSHMTCSMWMTCVCALTKYARAKELREFDGVQDGGACDFPQSSSRMDCSTCGWNGDAPPSNPSSWGCWRPALLKNEVDHGTMATSKRVQDWRPHFR